MWLAALDQQAPLVLVNPFSLTGLQYFKHDFCVNRKFSSRSIQDGGLIINNKVTWLNFPIVIRETAWSRTCERNAASKYFK